MKNLVMATVLGLLLVSANAPAEASTPESAIGSQVEVVEVMHRSHPPQHWHRGRRWNPPPPPPPKGGGRDWHYGGRGGHQPHFSGSHRW